MTREEIDMKVARIASKTSFARRVRVEEHGDGSWALIVDDKWRRDVAAGESGLIWGAELGYVLRRTKDMPWRGWYEQGH